jgi:hypothetical protein
MRRLLFLMVAVAAAAAMAAPPSRTGGLPGLGALHQVRQMFSCEAHAIGEISSEPGAIVGTRCLSLGGGGTSPAPSAPTVATASVLSSP